MCTSMALSVSLACFVLCGLTSSKPLQSTSGTSPQEWNQKLLNMRRATYEGYLAFTLIAASSGRSCFEQPEPLTEDCVRTARVAMNLLNKPSTLLKTKELLGRCLPKTIVTSNQNPAEILCKNVNEAVNQSKSSFPDFEDLKTKVELPHPTKQYIVEIPQQTTAEEFAEKPLDVDNDPEFIHFDMMLKFYETHRKISNAILLLAERDAIKSTVDGVFIQARDDYLKDLLKNNAKFLIGSKNNHEDFAKKVDEYFLKNPSLKEEYKKLKEEEY